MNIAKELNTLRDLYSKDTSTEPCFTACMRVFAGYMQQIEAQLNHLKASRT